MHGPRSLLRRGFIVAAVLVPAMLQAAPQDPAYVDAAPSGNRSTAAPVPRAVRPPTGRQPASLATQWRALTQPTPDQYRRAYGDAQIRDRFRAPAAQSSADTPGTSRLSPRTPTPDWHSLQQSSDEFARTLQPTLQQLRQYGDTQLRGGQR